jgi:hypothetical protein
MFIKNKNSACKPVVRLDLSESLYKGKHVLERMSLAKNLYVSLRVLSNTYLLYLIVFAFV